MANVKDNNNVPVVLGMWNTNGTIALKISANATLHTMDVLDGTDGIDYGNNSAVKDDNGEPSLLALSNAGDNAIVPLYVNSSGELLIQSS